MHTHTTQKGDINKGGDRIFRPNKRHTAGCFRRFEF